jgi:hypothetical protein
VGVDPGLQAEQLRLEQIQQDNLALLKRMQAIMNVSAAAPPVEFIPGVRITRNQVPVTDTFLSTATTVPGAAKPLETFIGSKQRRDLAKIAEDNKVRHSLSPRCPRLCCSAARSFACGGWRVVARGPTVAAACAQAILMRITTKRSEFSRDKWAAERKRELELMQMITKDTTSGHLPQGTNGKSIFNACTYGGHAAARCANGGAFTLASLCAVGMCSWSAAPRSVGHAAVAAGVARGVAAGTGVRWRVLRVLGGVRVQLHNPRPRVHS